MKISEIILEFEPVDRYGEAYVPMISTVEKELSAMLASEIAAQIDREITQTLQGMLGMPRFLQGKVRNGK